MSSGSNLVLAPARGARKPAVATLIVSSEAVTTSFRSMSSLAQSQDADVARRRPLHAGAHFEPELEIADDLGGIVVDAPGGEQRLQIGGMVGHRARKGIRGILAARVGAAVRIDEQQHPARRA